MLFDLNVGVCLRTDEHLSSDAINVFKVVEKLNNFKIFIDCRLISSEKVQLNYENDQYEFQRNNWIANVIQLLPKVYSDILKGYILLHGSCLRYKNNIIVLLGRSLSGKSTALYYLLKNPESNYVSDEIVVINPIEKSILPLSSKPIQLREDVPVHNGMVLLDDAWNMKKVVYIVPKDRVESSLRLDDYKLYFCLIKYKKNRQLSISQLCNYDLLNLLFQSCFNISNIRHNWIIKLLDTNHVALRIEYDGNTKKILEYVDEYAE